MYVCMYVYIGSLLFLLWYTTGSTSTCMYISEAFYFFRAILLLLLQVYVCMYVYHLRPSISGVNIVYIGKPSILI